MKDRAASMRADIVVQEIEWLDRLRAKLDPHIDKAVATLAELASNASRESTRLKASAKLVGLYAGAINDAAKLKLLGQVDEGPDERVRVVLVDKAELPAATALLAAQHQAARKQSQDVS